MIALTFDIIIDGLDVDYSCWLAEKFQNNNTWPIRAPYNIYVFIQPEKYVKN